MKEEEKRLKIVHSKGTEPQLKLQYCFFCSSMEDLLFIFIASLCIYASIKSLLKLLHHNNNNHKLPPGPPNVPILGNFLWLLKSSQNFSSIEPILRRLCTQYGPIVTLHIGSRPAIFITGRDVAHRALVQNGSAFANRPPALETTRILSSNQHTVTTAPYGPVWRLLRRNLMSEILHPSRLKSYSLGRKWVLDILRTKLIDQAKAGDPICLLDHVQFAFFCMLVFMCFGEKLNEDCIREIEAAQRASLVNFVRFNVLNFMPRLGKIVFRRRWKELTEIRRKQEEILLPLIKEREEQQKKKGIEEIVVSYVDTLFDLRLPDDVNVVRKLNDEEMVSLCSEFINGGTDTTSTTLQWTMANLVKHQDTQEKLFLEINGVVKLEEMVKEEDLVKMPYLKAVVLETLRRHPPGHFILPRAVTEETILDGYVVPRDAMVNFTVAEMGWDPNVWKDPMKFRPERFINSGDDVVDIKGIREIKMMPFGAGRRVCPAIGLAMLHLEYFVANLVRDFKWTAVDGDDVDLMEKQDFTTVMKNPLRAHISPRV